MKTEDETTLESTDALQRRARLVAALKEMLAGLQAANDAPIMLETHLSWVILAGEDAWKIKKPVAFDFVDFSTLERRRLACEEEVRLNRQYSPSLYLGVVPIVGTLDSPRFAPDTFATGRILPDSTDLEPIEYAVRMKRFEQRAIFSAMVAEDRLDAATIDALAEHVAGLHRAAGGRDRVAVDREAGSPAVVRRQILQALDGVAASLGEASVAGIRERLGGLLDDSLLVLDARRAQGFVRECHADLHLANICCHQGRVAVFDCLEFDPLLRRIDVMADLAFIIADLLAWRREALAYRLLDRYLAVSGDHAGLRVLRLYVAYRALVRARVGLLSSGSSSSEVSSSDTSSSRRPSVDDYVEVTESILTPGRPTLAILHGLSGSGKSRVAERLCARLALIQLRSDVERKRLLDLPALATTASMPGQGAYSAGHSQATYAQLAAKAAQILGAGFSVLVDATFQRRADRRRFADLARSLGAAFLIIDVHAAEQVMRARIRLRLESGTDPSEADETVLATQLDAAEALDPDERIASIAFDNSLPRDTAALDAALGPVRERLARDQLK